MKQIITIVFLFMVSTTLIAEKKAEYKIAKVILKFEVGSRFGDTTGEFTKTSLDIQDYQNGVAKLTIFTNSITTGNGMRDKHLKDEDFFDCPKYPQAIFQLQSLKEKATGQLIARGKLTIKKKTKPLQFTIKTTAKKENRQGVYKGTVTIKRKDFAIDYDSIINPIDNEVQIKFTVVIETK